MTFTLTINTDNAAFGENVEERNTETARIIREIAEQVEDGLIDGFFSTVFDINGNDVGRAAFKHSIQVVAN